MFAPPRAVHAAAAWTLLCLGLGACGLTEVSRPDGPLVLLTGRVMQDTINAYQPIRVRVPVSDTGPAPRRSGYRVTLEHAEPCLGCARQLPFATGDLGGSIGPWHEDTTDTNGEVHAAIGFGDRAGTFYVRIRVNSMDLTDSVEIRTAAGGAYEVAVEPRDTVVLRGGRVGIRRILVADRWGNQVSDPIGLRALDGITTTSGMDVRGESYGAGAVEAFAGNGVTPLSVNVVPDGLISTLLPDRLRISRTDGAQSSFILLPGPGSRNTSCTDWSPDGQTLVLDGLGDYLGIVTAQGNYRVIGDTVFIGRREPEFSADGQWIYYSAQDPTTGKWQARRVRPDGSGDALVALGGDLPPSPSPSPDGLRVAYIGAAHELRVLTLATGASTVLQAPVMAPAWSPGGERIAFLAGNGTWGYVSTIRPDGTGLQTTTVPVGWGNALDWSPDGRWLMAGRTIIDPDSETVVSLNSLHQTMGGAMTWKPR